MQLSKRDYLGLSIIAISLIALIINTISLLGPCSDECFGRIANWLAYFVIAIAYFAGTATISQSPYKTFFLQLGIALGLGFVSFLRDDKIFFTFVWGAGTFIYLRLVSLTKNPVYKSFLVVAGVVFIFCKLILNLF